MKLSEVCANIEGELIRDGEFEKLNFCTANVGYSFLSFLEKEKFADKVSENVSCLITTSKIAKLFDMGSKGLFVSDSPKYAFYQIHNELARKHLETANTVIASSAEIGENVKIAEKNVIIGEGVKIGDNVVICENVEIGESSIIHSNTVVGGRSFNYAKDIKGNVLGWFDAGRVYIGKDVEICSCAHIAQGCLQEDITWLDDQCKIDSFVHVGHGAHIGACTLVSAGAIIGGNSMIGTDAWIGINATVSNRIRVGNGARVSLGAVVTKDVGSMEIVSGNFAIPHDLFLNDLKMKASR